MRKEVVVFLLFLTGCSAKVSEWENTYRYQAPAGWSKKKEEEKVLAEFKDKEKPVSEKQESIYQKEVQEKILSLLLQEPTPLKVPDKILRVLILPYVDSKGDFVSQKYVFFKAEEGKWILGEYLLKKGEALKLLRPLEGQK